MGEYADMAIDDMLSMDEYELNHPEECEYDGGLSGRGIFRRRYHKTPKTCRSCGASNLYWYRHDDQWLLHEFNIDEGEFVPHSCKLKNAFKRKDLNRNDSQFP